MPGILFNRRLLQDKAISIEAIKELARQELPRPVYDYAEGGAGDEFSLGQNEAKFKNFSILPRPLRGAGERDLSVEIFGKSIRFPLIIGPTGLSGLFWPKGELETAKAALTAGVGYCLSHGSVCTIEEFAPIELCPRWMQVFIYKDRGFTREFCERAYAANFDGLVLTIDNQIPGKRERDLRNGFTIPPNLRFSGYASMLLNYKWLWRMRSELKKITFGNYAKPGESTEVSELAARMVDLLDPKMTWDDVIWLRRIWKKPLIIKGILHPEDAVKATEVGVDGIVVTNHGGRQLDDTISPILALSGIVEKVNQRIPVFVDGGIRRGTDIFKALALGARACLVGRPQLWGLAIGGQKGVEKMLSVFYEEIDLAMGLCGVSSISEITRDLIHEHK